jgi:hypothetical protein
MPQPQPQIVLYVVDSEQCDYSEERIGHLKNALRQQGLSLSEKEAQRFINTEALISQLIDDDGAKDRQNKSNTEDSRLIQQINDAIQCQNEWNSKKREKNPLEDEALIEQLKQDYGFKDVDPTLIEQINEAIDREKAWGKHNVRGELTYDGKCVLTNEVLPTLEVPYIVVVGDEGLRTVASLKESVPFDCKFVWVATHFNEDLFGGFQDHQLPNVTIFPQACVSQNDREAIEHCQITVIESDKAAELAGRSWQLQAWQTLTTMTEIAQQTGVTAPVALASYYLLSNCLTTERSLAISTGLGVAAEGMRRTGFWQGDRGPQQQVDELELHLDDIEQQNAASHKKTK